MRLVKSLGWLLFLIITWSGCRKEPADRVEVSTDKINLPAEGGEATFFLQTNAGKWRIQNLADWIIIDPTNGTESSATITVRVADKTKEDRSESLVIIAGNAETGVMVNQPASEYLYSLTCNYVSLNFKKGGSSNVIEVSSDAPEWHIESDSDWLGFSPSAGGEGTTNVSVTATENPGHDPREALITIHADYAPPVSIIALQKGDYYPDYNTDPLPPDESGMTRTAPEIAAVMRLGWNLGNSLEAIGGETAWGNPQVTEELIRKVKDSGFNAIRLPCSWDQYLESQATAKIRDEWLNRVKQVIQYCIDNDLFVLLNIHWDGGWLENNVSPDSQEENNAKQKALWEQIATQFREFDDRLLFSSANEPNVDNEEQMAVLNSYHQTFINAVRSTGGKNSYRILVIQGPSTDIEKTYNLWDELPNDIPGRLMAEVHYYTPYQFCLMESDQSWGKMFYFWGDGYHSTALPDRNASWGEENTVDQMMGMMNEQFVQNGIPVILGEFGVSRRSTLEGDDLALHLASRAYYLKYVSKKALEKGVIPFYWDNGGLGNLASGIFDRNNNTVFDQQALDALLEGSGQ